jgi:hypothetical protein
VGPEYQPTSSHFSQSGVPGQPGFGFQQPY